MRKTLIALSAAAALAAVAASPATANPRTAIIVTVTGPRQ